MQRLHAQLLRAAIDPLGAIRREAVGDQLLDRAALELFTRGAAVGASTRSHLLDGGRLVGGAVVEVARAGSLRRALAEGFELRRELRDARFERRALLDLRRERVLERREPSRPTRRRQRRRGRIAGESPSVVSSSAKGGDELGCSQNASTSPAPRPASTSSKVFSMSVTYASATRLSTGLLSMSFTGNNGATKIRRRVRGFDLVKRLLAAAAGLVLLLIAAAYALVAASLPRRGGEARLPGLESPLAVALDARAIATVRGESFTDVLRGQGYLHAQERFFQMDLLRRSSAGELAELFGERALAADRGQRPFDYRELARRLRSALPAEQNAWLDAYTEGVNAGLADLGARPPEYWLAGARTAAVAARGQSARRADVLHDAVEQRLVRARAGRHARRVAAAAVRLPDAVDVALRSSRAWQLAERPDGRLRAVADPGRRTSSICGSQRAPERGGAPRVEPPLTGPASNNWAVDATRGDDGRAIVANDPHSELAAAEHLLSHRARVAGPRSARREHSRACPAC